jgi:hypothetical protein
MAIRDLPKGITSAFMVLDGSLLLMTLGLCGLAPMASNPAFVDPIMFAGLARASIRLLSINVAF